MSSVSSLPFQIPNAQVLNNQCFSMSEFTGNGGDGDLQAVVRGFNNCFSSPCTSTILDYPQTCFSPLIVQEEDVLFSSFPDLLFESNTVLDELEQLYKPFYPSLGQLSPRTSLSASLSDHEERDAKRVQENEAFPESTIVVAAAAAAAAPLPVKYKRRKTQHKRVVVEVAAEGLSSDVWAWRKYGQKPIKGSPHPRSYYRCSSLKGCLARKQVERSQSDPQMFVITYTAEHCHGHPVRKSSLAGTTRHKFSLPKSPATSNPDASMMSADSGCSLSPPVTPVLAMKVEDGQRISDINEASRSSTNIGLDNMCDVMLCDDLFWGFDEFDRLNF